MPIIAVGDIYEVKVGCYYGGQAGINVLHYRCASIAGSSTTDTSLGFIADANWAALYKGCMGSHATYFGVRVQRVWPLPVTLAAVVSNNVGAGSFGSGCLPSVVSGIIKLSTEFTGRRERGRLYLPFPGAGAHDSAVNRPTAGYVSTANVLASNMLALVAGAMGNTATFELGVYHRFAHTVTAVISATTQPKWGSVHKRGNYGQANSYPPF